MPNESIAILDRSCILQILTEYVVVRILKNRNSLAAFPVRPIFATHVANAGNYNLSQRDSLCVDV